MASKTAVGRMVDERMRARGYNQTSLANVSNKRLTQSYISQLIRGDIDMPGDDKIMVFHELLGLTKEDFYRADGRIETPRSTDVYDLAPLAELVAALRIIPTVPPQLETLASQTARTREKVIRSLARKWAVDLEEALNLVEETQLELPID